MWGLFAGFARKQPPHIPFSTAIPKDPKLIQAGCHTETNQDQHHIDGGMQGAQGNLQDSTSISSINSRTFANASANASWPDSVAV